MTENSAESRSRKRRDTSRLSSIVSTDFSSWEERPDVEDYFCDKDDDNLSKTFSDNYKMDHAGQRRLKRTVSDSFINKHIWERPDGTEITTSKEAEVKFNGTLPYLRRLASRKKHTFIVTLNTQNTRDNLDRIATAAYRKINITGFIHGLVWVDLKTDLKNTALINFDLESVYGPNSEIIGKLPTNCTFAEEGSVQIGGQPHGNKFTVNHLNNVTLINSRDCDLQAPQDPQPPSKICKYL